jgi:hypothetical protein
MQHFMLHGVRGTETGLRRFQRTSLEMPSPGGPNDGRKIRTLWRELQHVACGAGVGDEISGLAGVA